MSLRALVELIRQSDAVRRMASPLRPGVFEQMVTGVSGSQKTVLVAALFEELQSAAGAAFAAAGIGAGERLGDRRGGPAAGGAGGPVGGGVGGDVDGDIGGDVGGTGVGTGRGLSVLVITPGRTSAEQWYRDLVNLLGEERLGLYLPLETLPHEEVTTSPELTGRRLEAMLRLLGIGYGPSVVVADAGALTERLLPSEVVRQHTLVLRVGQVIPLEQVASTLAAAGYERRTRVDGPGQFAVRGDILDVFPLHREAPVRIQWFDREIESIRPFDVDSQRSVGQMDAVLLPPAREFVVAREVLDLGLQRLDEQARRQAGLLRAAGRKEEAARLLERVARHRERLAETGYAEGAEQYKPLFYPRLPLLLDYLDGGLVVVDEPGRIKEQLGALESEFLATFRTLLERGRVLPCEADCFAWWDELVQAARRHAVLYLSLFPRRLQEVQPQAVHPSPVRPAEPFHGNWELLAQELRRRSRSRYRVLLALSSTDRAERARDVLREANVLALWAPGLDGQLKPGNVVVAPFGLQSGFDFPELRLLVLTDDEVYGQQRRARRPRTASGASSALRIRDYLELKEGDYVVHVNHGIGRYEGIQTMEVAGVRRDYLVIRYAGEDRLYVPTDQVHLLERYVGSDDHPPKLSRLGSAEWARIKKRVRESVQEMAEQLLRLYAERQTLEKAPCSRDTPWQREFEEAFPYEETPDQRRATEEVKADMERPRPMDRLLCGDAGYGKTEVAMRAAFKAVMDGKQVAVLVPTTILAQQHHRTFTERFAGYPVRIEMLSRFQTPAEQNRILADVRAGAVDILIGTHRLLSKDVQFKDLGLLIIDEEQRFGVAQKERLKELKRTVDALTMTATPIPRTLHMALSGVRDMSVIETPPEGRYPVRTYVVEYNDDLVRDAIERELARNGQVYFVYNRVQTIERMAAHVQQLVPHARVAVAHGQMEESRLERVMLDFLNHEYDVLVCTTIIETGMDIGNVNTLIVYDADRLGLAQLYQLRGRVGRSDRVAYAYFTYRRDRELTQDAERRLAAIREFTELGSGFKIALKDLEIRGAGNLLGPEQHGHIAAVGFELYCQLLEEAIRELKGEPVQKPPEPTLDLPVDAYLPGTYIPDSAQKVEFYKRIAGATTAEELADIRQEMEDRFGDLPGPAEHLLLVARIKQLAREVGVGHVSAQGDTVTVRAWEGLQLPAPAVTRAAANLRGRLTYRPGRLDTLWLRRSGLSDGELLTLLVQLLEQMRQALPAGNGHAAGAASRAAGTSGSPGQKRAISGAV